MDLVATLTAWLTAQGVPAEAEQIRMVVTATGVTLVYAVGGHRTKHVVPMALVWPPPPVRARPAVAKKKAPPRRRR